MKNKLIGLFILIVICIIVFVLCLIGTTNKPETYSTDDTVIAAVREYLGEQIHENTQIDILGYINKDKWFLYWFSIGDEAYHFYITGEFAITKAGNLHPISFHKPIDRGGDVASIYWSGGYSFLVNSSKCTMIELVTSQGTELITVDDIPFVYCIDHIPLSYRFLNETMEEI